MGLLPCMSFVRHGLAIVDGFRSWVCRYGFWVCCHGLVLVIGVEVQVFGP